MTKANQSEGASQLSRRKPVRWWPALTILALGIAAEIGIRLWPKVSFQERNIATAQVVIVSLLLSLLWVLFFSRLRWLARFLVGGGVAGVVATAAGLFRIRG